MSINITDNDHSDIVSYIISNPELIIDEIIPQYFENIDFDDYKEFKKIVMKYSIKLTVNLIMMNFRILI